MKLAYVCPDRGIPIRGHKGASVHVREITTALQAIGHRVTVLCASMGAPNPPPDVDRICELKPEVMADADALGALLAEFGSDAVVERYSLESGAARRASARLGIAHVLEVNAPLVLEAARYRALADVDAWLERERAFFVTADAVLVVQRQLEDYVHQVAPGIPVTYVPNGVALERFAGAAPADLGLPAHSVVIGFVGSMKPWHGVDDLLTAFASVAPRHPKAQLVLVGQGPETEAMQHRITLEGLEGRAHLTGAVRHDQIPSVLRCFDIATAPFRPSPGFYFGPMKVFEYLAAGLPIVYPAIGDMPEVIGEAGVSYPAGDVVELAAALDRLLDDPRRRARLGAAAKRTGSRYSWANAARAVTEVVEAAAANAVGPRIQARTLR